MKDDYGLDASYTYEEDDEWGDDEAAWTAEEEQEEEATDAKDESSAYLEFLNEEASSFPPRPTVPLLTLVQAQKFGHLENELEQNSDDELGENSVLLESPLDKLEPYQIFRSCLMSKLAVVYGEGQTSNTSRRVATRTAAVLQQLVVPPVSR